MTQGGKNHTVDILLATYNGEDYIDEQLQSLLSQTRPDWRLLVRDDGSNDGTRSRLLAFRDQNPDRVVLLQDDLGTLGACRNYGHLMERSDAPYVAFCDQDDVWVPEKLELELKKIGALETKHGCHRPLLVFSDLTVVDRDLRLLGDSFWKFQNLDPSDSTQFASLILRNVVTGCTALLNRALVEKSLPLPDQAYMHDWWVALVAAAMGHADFVDRPTVRYRQHGKNVFGARRASLVRNPDRIVMSLMSAGLMKQRISRVFAQGAAFRDRYASELADRDRGLLAAALEIPRVNYLERARIGWEIGVFSYDFWRMAYLLALSGNR